MLDTANCVDGHMSNFRRKLENIGVGTEPTDSQHVSRWQSFRAVLDEFGSFQPQLCTDVVVGAERTFRAMLAWFPPACTGKVGQP
jgi:heme oxygenase